MGFNSGLKGLKATAIGRVISR